MVSPSGPVGPSGPVSPIVPGTPVQARDSFGFIIPGQWVTYDANGRVAPYRAPTQGSPDTTPTTDGAGVQYIISGGRAFTLDGQPYVPVPIQQRDPNRPSTSFSYSTSSQDPAQFAARQAQELQIAQMQIESRAAEAGLDRSFRAGESAADRAQRLALQLQQQGFMAGESAADRSFRAGESAADRQFRAGESATDRAIRAAEFASTYGLNVAQFEAQQNQAESEFNRRRSADALNAAKQYADLINTVDPNAFDAFLRTGGGNIGNSIAAGGDALSQRAALPSARSQRALDGINASSFQRTTIGNSPPAAAGSVDGYSAQQVSEFERVNPNWRAQNAAGQAMARAFNSQAQSQPVSVASSSTVDPRTEANRRMEAQGVPSLVPRFAFGSGQAQGTFIAGDSTDPNNPGAGGAKPELITLNDPTGTATASVTPLETPGTGGSKLGALFSAIAGLMDEEDGGTHMMPDGSMMKDSDMPPRYAFGTSMPGEEITAEDQPYIQNVLDFRRNATVPNFNPFDVGFRNVNPFSRASFFAGRQTRYGIPVAAQEFESRQFEVPGQSRGIMSSQGY
jgi:hypothetical protein